VKSAGGAHLAATTHRVLAPTLAALLLAVPACARPRPGHHREAAMATTRTRLTLSSAAFHDHAAIPARHTCEGADLSPALEWSGAPEGTRSLALIVDDPDAPDPKAPNTTWVHWVLYDLPPTTTSLPEGTRHAPRGAHDGVNDWKQPGWRGPCPPVGRHRYFFKLYALDRTLGDLRSPTKAAVETAMKGHVLAEATLMGTYEKTR
jgi:Raf kinase inhibitor-like YbhB/YbcL family protein